MYSWMAQPFPSRKFWKLRTEPAILFSVGQKICEDGFPARFKQIPQLFIQYGFFIFREFRPFPSDAGCFPDGRSITRQGLKGLKLRRPVQHGHSGMSGGGGTGQIDDIVICAAQALCPPILLFCSAAVAPSTRFVPFKMAFLPYLLLMLSIASWSFRSRASSAAWASFCA